MKRSFLISVTFTAVTCLATQAKADKPPLGLSDLRQSDLIVVGTISQIRIESEPSRIERAAGNYDWGIYVTLAVENVEKGRLADTEIEFRCYRIKYRRSICEYLTTGGQRPIPGTGTRIRAYLNAGRPMWEAAVPNGITAPDANDDASVLSSAGLRDAFVISGELRSRSYTFFLPLEVWELIFVILLIILVIVFTCRFIKRRKTRVNNSSRTRPLS